ncbi:hypothetical protein ACA30_13430 [Virgibacillus soli]|nr:hypothetical protein ACA30_13430 [Virgibacillus soli]
MANVMIATFECTSQKECRRKRERWEELQEKYSPLGQKELDEFNSNIKTGKSKVRFDKHFHKRSLERSISVHDVKDVLTYGWVIERNKTAKSTSILILGYVGRNYRPLHVVFDMLNESDWIAVTAYDPNSHAWKWNEHFDKRVCFCNPENNE